MFERFTRRARTVVADANDVARRSGSSAVRPEHLLDAILANEQSLAVRVLSALGAPAGEVQQVLSGLRGQYAEGLDADDAEALRALGIDLADVVRRIDHDFDGRPDRGCRVRFSPGAKRAIELSLRSSVGLGDGFIGTEHLLVGLVGADDPVVRDTLAAFDVSAEAVRAAVGETERRTG